MKARELREKSGEELVGLKREMRSRMDELIGLVHARKVKNVKERSLVRRDLARIETELHARAIKTM